VLLGHSAAPWQQFPQLVPGVLVVGDVRPDVWGAPRHRAVLTPGAPRLEFAA
jgi:hypothetical protein